MKKILVIDEYEPWRKLLEIELGEEGYDVILAENPNKALSKCRIKNLDLIIIDCHKQTIYPNLFVQLYKLFDLIMAYNIKVIFYGAPEIRRITKVKHVVKSSDLTELKNEIKKILF